jgi:hypothetical protein
MTGTPESLNLSVAAGVMLYEVRRQITAADEVRSCLRARHALAKVHQEVARLPDGPGSGRMGGTRGVPLTGWQTIRRSGTGWSGRHLDTTDRVPDAGE